MDISCNNDWNVIVCIIPIRNKRIDYIYTELIDSWNYWIYK